MHNFLFDKNSKRLLFPTERAKFGPTLKGHISKIVKDMKLKFGGYVLNAWFLTNVPNLKWWVTWPWWIYMEWPYISFYFFQCWNLPPFTIFPTPLFLTPIFSIFYTWFLIPPIISSYSTFIPFIHSLIFILHPDLYPPPQSLFVFPHHPSAISSKTQGTLKGTYPLCCGM